MPLRWPALWYADTCADTDTKTDAITSGAPDASASAIIRPRRLDVDVRRSFANALSTTRSTLDACIKVDQGSPKTMPEQFAEVAN